MYGRQEMAKKLWPDRAGSFSVAHRMQMHRRRKRWAACVGLVVVMAGTGTLLFGIFRPSGRLQVQSSVRREFRIDNTFAITVLDAPKCAKAVCSVEIRFRNVSGYTTDIGAGSFADPERIAVAELCDPSPLAGACSLSPPVSYVISLTGNGNHYGYIDAGFSANNLLPNGVTTADFTFDIPARTTIGELELSGKSGDAFVVFSNP